jgi:tRNA-specific 2-thiouridylase
MKVVVGLSGGVDSAVSAALLKDAGHDVVGVFIKIWSPEFTACTWQEDRLSAKRVAAHLGIPFVEVDASARYKELVVAPMVKEYAEGRTPNPDVLCNQYVKFVLLKEAADSVGASHFATGHYARVREVEGVAHLLKGVDTQKDQSYFLYRVPQALLGRALFPVGEFTKQEVRDLAIRYDLPNASRKDSQGICFVGYVSIAEFLGQYLDLSPGPVVNVAGEVIGEHTGAQHYTRGMRHGFTLFHSTVPHYVVSTDCAHNTITVDTSVSSAETTHIRMHDATWVAGVPLGDVAVAVRYRHALVPAHLSCHSGTCIIETEVPVVAVPGQSVVVYREEECCGGGIIA